jgi:ribosomal-protein-alanine N-acetyltransferase
MTVLETQRLRIDAIRDADFDILYRLQSDPETMRFIRKPETDPEVVRGRMEEWKQYAAGNPGLGVWAIRWKETGAFAGYGVLRHVKFEPGREFEVGYTVAPEFWGRGIASEFTRAMVEYAFRTMDAPRVVAYTDPDHRKSQRVLEKCGFRYTGADSVYGEVDAVFTLENPNFTA